MTSQLATIVKSLDHADFVATKLVYDALNANKFIGNIPYVLGLLPYELYVLPGMFVSLIIMVWSGSFHPAQFHLVPHWFAFSLAMYLKHSVSRKRPGCVRTGMKSRIAKNHCTGSTMNQSFPSGHTIISAALATSLIMYLNDSSYSDDEKTLFRIPFYEPKYKVRTQIAAVLVVIFVGLHRISFGYHYIGDVLTGAFLGTIVGFLSYRSYDVARQQAKRRQDALAMRISQVVIIGISLAAMYDFFTHKIWKLAEIKH